MQKLNRNGFQNLINTKKMKTKSQLTIFILITGLLVSGIVYGDDPVKGSGNGITTTTGSGMGWQEQTQRTNTLVYDGVRITTGPSIGTTGLTWNLSFSTNLVIVECCKPATLKQSWCDYNADDARCPD